MSETWWEFSKKIFVSVCDGANPILGKVAGVAVECLDNQLSLPKPKTKLEVFRHQTLPQFHTEIYAMPFYCLSGIALGYTFNCASRLKQLAFFNRHVHPTVALFLFSTAISPVISMFCTEGIINKNIHNQKSIKTYLFSLTEILLLNGGCTYGYSLKK